MTPHVLQDHLEAVVSACVFITPFLLVSTVVCALLRKSRWIAPFWVFAVCPVAIIFWMVFQVVILPSVSGPDGGFVGMQRMFLLYGAMFEVVPGIFLLLAFPRAAAWGKHAVVPCCVTAVITFAGWIAAIPHIPVPR